MTTELPPDSDDEDREWFVDPTGRHPYRAKQYGIWSDLATDGTGGPPLVDEEGGEQARRPHLTGSANVPWRSVDDIVGAAPRAEGTDGAADSSSPPHRNRLPLILAAVVVLIVIAVVGVVLVSGSGSDDEAELAGSTDDTVTTSTASPPSSTAAPTTSVATTSAVPLPSPTPRSFSGSGDQVIDVGEIVSGPYLVRATYAGSSKFQVALLNNSGNGSQGLINTTGPYEGSVPANFAPGEMFDFVDVRADGAWTVDFVDLLNAPVASTQAGQTYNGSGDQVVFFNATAPVGARITCADCAGTFRVIAWGAARSELVNESGAYDQRVVVPAGTEVIQVSASLLPAGSRPVWSITPE